MPNKLTRNVIFDAQQRAGVTAGEIVFDQAYRCFGKLELYDVWTVRLQAIQDIIPIFLPKRHMRLKPALYQLHPLVLKPLWAQVKYGK